MKIDKCLVSCDLNMLYLDFFDIIKLMWKEICNIDIILLLVADEIPPTLKNEPNIILFKPIKNMSTIFQAQCIRLLYPALLTGNIIISDMDIIPLNKKYFIDSIANYDDTKFISYRDAYLSQNMIGICYNIANTNIWKQIFKINNHDDIVKTLQDWYNINYSGTKNCEGWFTDQEMLYTSLITWKNNKDHIILTDNDLNFVRLDKRHKNYINKMTDTMIHNIKTNKYTDFHIMKPYSKYKNTINTIISLSLEYNHNTCV